ncbi:MAG: hypothetical protein K2P78_03265 [Gemmataceae bacterium]|nr:hypothetical protein [Gemmataceae bacterium]
MSGSSGMGEVYPVPAAAARTEVTVKALRQAAGVLALIFGIPALIALPFVLSGFVGLR